MKLTVSKSKNSASFYVQKSIRTKSGGTTTITVEKLGNIEEVRARAKGKDPYEWAQEYVNELNRQEHEQKKSIIVSYSPSKLLKKDEQKLFNVGYLFLQDIYTSLGLPKICTDIASRHGFAYDLDEILSRLIYTRILYPSSKYSSNTLARKFVEQPGFGLHDIYRALSVLAEECDFIQSEVYQNSQKVLERRKDILYYDCTNYFFEIEEESGLKRYGKGKQHQPMPIVGMGLFMDYDGIPIAFDIYPGNKNEQPTMKPLEQKVIRDFGLSRIVVCTDAGLSSCANRKFNDHWLGEEALRNFITTQSIKQLPAYLKEYALSPDGWRLPGDRTVYDLNEVDPGEFYDSIFYKERWITEGITDRERKNGLHPLEQHLIVSFSFKYQDYLRKIRQGQVGRAQKLIDSGDYKKKGRNQNDPKRFIARTSVTADGEVCDVEQAYIDTGRIAEEEMYDGFYAVCTNMIDVPVETIVHINSKRWQIEECFRIMKTEFRARPVYLRNDDRIKAHFLTCFLALFVYRILEKRLGEKFTCENILETLKDMMVARPGDKLGYIPSYTRTDLTDALHGAFGFRTDYEILTDISMKGIIRQTKKKPKLTARTKQ
ncbi:MAG: transposase [Lachnospiraceae bacterium]|nr:transposase [Lachnospiraceae bacterium]